MGKKFISRRHSEATRLKIARAVSKPCPARRGHGNGMYGRNGKANPNFKHGQSPERQRVYSSAAWQEFRRQVCERDGHRCRRCGERVNRKRGMHMHHLRPWKAHPELRLAPDNIVLLCRECHEWVHSAANAGREWLEIPC